MEGGLDQLDSEIESLRKQKHEIDRYITELETKERDGGVRKRFETEAKKRPRETDRDAGRFEKKRERPNDHDSESSFNKDRNNNHANMKNRNSGGSNNLNTSADKIRVTSSIVRVEGEKPRIVPENSQVKQRNMKILGLINGTLQKFQKDLSEKTEARSRREEIEQKVEAQVIEESTKLREEHKKNLIEHREKALRIREELREKEEEKQQRILTNQWKKQRENLSKFIKTKTFPHLYYIPAHHTDETRVLLEASAKETLGQEYSSFHSSSSTSGPDQAQEDEKQNGEPVASEQLLVETSTELTS